MPDPYQYPIPAVEFLVPKLLADLATCKTLPLKLSHMKHQEQLCDSSFSARSLKVS